VRLFEVAQLGKADDLLALRLDLRVFGRIKEALVGGDAVRTSLMAENGAMAFLDAWRPGDHFDDVRTRQTPAGASYCLGQRDTD
jgi:hypothetical protein